MRRILSCLLIGFMSLHCGKNQNIITPSGGPTPPSNVMAYSSGPQSVTLSWSAPPDIADSSFWGYIIRWGGTADSLVKGSTMFVATSLPAGLTAFSLSSRLNDGEVSGSPTVISWAPADRFSDSTFVLYEYVQGGALPVGPTAIYLSSSGGVPRTFPIDSSLQSSADFYLFGGTGGLPQALQLYSADLYDEANHATRFSTVTDQSSTLDYPRSSFPASSTFSNQSVTLNVNTIYYVQLAEPSGTYYARVLISGMLGTSPGRSITMRLSVQRASGVAIAGIPPSAPLSPLGLGMMLASR